MIPNNKRSRFVSIVLGLLLMSGCANDLQTSDGTSASTSSESASLYAKSTEDLVSDSTAEVAEDESCQAEDIDFASIQEKLIAKLTALVAKLEAVDTSSFDEEAVAQHEMFLTSVKADLAVVTGSTELSEEFKEIAQKVWHSHQGKKEKMGRHHRPWVDGEAALGESGSCRPIIIEKGKSAHCKDIEKLLSVEDISEELRELLENRYAEICEASEES